MTINNEPQSIITGESVEKFLAHHGVKGMKWGVRKDKGHEGERAKTKTIAKLDKKYDKSLRGIQGYVKVNNAVADRINPRLDILNAKPEYKVDMTLPANSKVHAKYIAEYQEHLKKSLEEAMGDLGTNASGTQRVHLKVVGEGLDASWEAYTENIKHADAQNKFRIKPKFNKFGQIVDQTITELDDGMTHNDGVNDFLAHYGVKGMKWGVRRDRHATVKVSTNVRPGRRVGTSGGTGQKASPDAVRAAVYKQKAKQSTTDALSNKELKALLNRMQMEQQYQQLIPKTKPQKARQFVSSLLLGTGKQQASRVVNTYAAQQVDSLLKKT